MLRGSEVILYLPGSSAEPQVKTRDPNGGRMFVTETASGGAEVAGWPGFGQLSGTHA